MNEESVSVRRKKAVYGKILNVGKSNRHLLEHHVNVIVCGHLAM